MTSAVASVVEAITPKPTPSAGHRYIAGCTCQGCDRYRAKQRDRDRARQAGQANRVDATRARAHIELLKRCAMTNVEIARLAGIGSRTVHQISEPIRQGRTATRKQIYRVTEEAILGLPLPVPARALTAVENDEPEHGTTARAKRHRYQGERPCRECLAAETRYHAEQKTRRQQVAA